MATVTVNWTTTVEEHHSITIDTDENPELWESLLNDDADELAESIAAYEDEDSVTQTGVTERGDFGWSRD